MSLVSFRSAVLGLAAAVLAGSTAVSAAHADETPDWAPDRSGITVYAGRTVAINLRDPSAPDDVKYQALNDRGRADERYGDTILFRPNDGEGGEFKLTYDACLGSECDFGTITITVYKQIPKFSLRSVKSSTGRTYVVGAVTADDGVYSGTPTNAVTVTRAGKTLGRGTVRQSLLNDRVNATTRPGILVSTPSTRGTYTYTVKYPGNGSVRAGTATVKVTVK